MPQETTSKSTLDITFSKMVGQLSPWRISHWLCLSWSLLQMLYICYSASSSHIFRVISLNTRFLLLYWANNSTLGSPPFTKISWNSLLIMYTVASNRKPNCHKHVEGSLFFNKTPLVLVGSPKLAQRLSNAIKSSRFVSVFAILIAVHVMWTFTTKLVA